VNFGPVSPEFKRVKGVQPLVGQQFVYVRFAAPLLDLAGISTEFSESITIQFCFTYTLEDITAMPRVLHASLCHAFLVSPHGIEMPNGLHFTAVGFFSCFLTFFAFFFFFDA